MSLQAPRYFPDRYIDRIQENPGENYFTPVLQEMLKSIAPPERVCDVGCGNGVFSIYLKNKTGCWLVGVDGSGYALSQAKEMGFDELHQVGDFSQDSLPFEDGVFDLVLNKDVLEHLLYPDHLVEEVARIVCRGGHVLVHVPNHFPILGRLRLLLHNTIDPFNYFPEAERWNYPHIRFFTRASLCNLFSRYGFEVVQDYSFYFFSPGRVGRLFPLSIRVALVRSWPDAWTEGYTILFRKRC